MDAKRVIDKLTKDYPGKKIIVIGGDNPTEIICELGKGLAVAVIDKSEAHYHKEMTEKYEVISGQLSVFKNDQESKLNAEDVLIIEPGVIHYAIGNETWARVLSDPAWTPEDHHLIAKDHK